MSYISYNTLRKKGKKSISFHLTRVELTTLTRPLPSNRFLGVMANQIGPYDHNTFCSLPASHLRDCPRQVQWHWSLEFSICICISYDVINME